MALETKKQEEIILMSDEPEAGQSQESSSERWDPQPNKF